MKNKIAFAGLIAALFPCIMIHAQNPVTKVFEDWNTAEATQNTFQHSVVRSKGLGGTTYHYVAGATINPNGGGYDMLVSKYNSSGTILWTQTYNGAGNGDDVATDVQIDAVGNVYICGSYYKDATDSNNAVIIKYNNAGTQQWVYTFNGAGSKNDGFAALTASGNSIIACGTTWVNSTNLYDILAIHVDSSGTNVWTTTWDYLSLNDGAHNMYSSAGNLYVTGGAQSAATTYKYALVKIKPSTGSVLSSSVTGGTGFGIDQVADIQTNATTGNIFITGSVFNATTLYDFRTIMLDSTLNIIWSSTYDGGNNLNDFGTGIKVDANSNVIVTGSSRTAANGNDFTTIKYNSSGTQLWVANYDGGIAADDSASAIAINDTNQIYVTGYSYNGSTNDYYTIRYDDAGNQIFGIGFNSIHNADDRASAIALDTLGNVIVTGQNKINDTTFTYTTVKYIEKSTLLPQDTIASVSNSFVFTENRGQLLNTDTLSIPQIRYYTIHGSPNVYFSDTSVSYVFAKVDSFYAQRDSIVRVDMKYKNANSGVKIRAMDERKDFSNFMLSYIAQPLGHVPNYNKLISFNVWNNVDVIYGSNRRGLKTYFICKPGGGGGEYSNIDLKYAGADSIRINSNGQLIIYTKLGKIVQPKAAAWQIDANGNYLSLGWQPSYNLVATNEVKFTSLGTYNSALPLVIAMDMGYDPNPASSIGNLDWSTYYGGAGMDIAYDLTTDNQGSVYMIGTTQSPVASFPQLNAFQGSLVGGQDAFIVKFDNGASRLWATYYGGNSYEHGYGIAIGNNQNLYITGSTSSSSLPTLPAGNNGVYIQANTTGDDAYIAEINSATGIPSWESFFGGWSHEKGYKVAVDQSDNSVYLVGRVGYTTGIDVAIGGIALTNGKFPVLDPGGAYFQTSFSGSSSGPSGAPNMSGFIAKFNSSHQLVWSTLFGGNDYDDIVKIAIGPGTSPDIAINGYTDTQTPGNNNCSVPTNGGFPLCNPYQGGYSSRSFIAKFTASGILKWSTYFPGNPGGLVYNSLGQLYVSGITANPPSTGCSAPTTTNNFPICTPSGAYTQAYGGGGSDAYIAKFSTLNTLMWSTYYGGSTNEDIVFPYQWLGETDLAVDGFDNIYMTGASQLVSGGFNDFPVLSYSGYYYQPLNQTLNNVPSAFIVCFNSNNQRKWATLYGGTGNALSYDGFDNGLAVAVSNDWKLYVTGFTVSTDFPNTCPTQTTGPVYCQGFTPPESWDAFLGRFDINLLSGETEIIQQSHGFQIYPNPASDELNLEFDALQQSDIQISIFNSVGQLVYYENLNDYLGSYKKQVSLAGFANGMYLIRVNFPDGTASKKFIRQQ